MDRHIAFIGDSFCADYALSSFGPSNLLYVDYEKKDYRWKNQRYIDMTQHMVSWPTEVAHRLGYQVANFGFGGMSWWHSWDMFLTHYWNQSSLDRGCLQTIVFCHTNPGRINATGCAGFSQKDLDKHHRRGVTYYFEHLHDKKFSAWAREQYFYDINRQFSNIKTVHLFCFDSNPDGIPGWEILPGVKFINPLVWISIGELVGTTQEIIHQMGPAEKRINHMSNYNNHVLSEIIFDAIENYSPGVRYLDMNRFVLVNPSYAQWPDGNFGTK